VFNVYITLSLADVTVRAIAFVYLNYILQVSTNCAQVKVWLCLVANTGQLDGIRSIYFLDETDRVTLWTTSIIPVMKMIILLTQTPCLSVCHAQASHSRNRF